MLQKQKAHQQNEKLNRLIHNLWSRLWHGKDPDPFLFAAGMVTAVIMAFPIFYVVIRSITAGADRWARLMDTRIPSLMWNTLTLAFCVTVLSGTIGISLAWLLHRYRLPGEKIWVWLLALPLLIPPYVGAMTYVIVLGPQGWLASLLDEAPFGIYSFGGTLFVLTAFTYPYVLLIASASLKKMSTSYEEAARSLGMSPSAVFWKVYIPMLRPAMGAGGMLVFLYVLSDFGAVAMLRYTTFTSAIYYQMGSYDTLSATVLSTILIMMTVLIMWVETRSRKKQRYYQSAGSLRPHEKRDPGRKKSLVLGWFSLVFFLAFLVPMVVLLYWSRQGIAAGALDGRFWGYALNSFKVAGFTAFISMILGLPVVYLKSRNPSIFTSLMDRFSYSGYALPGVIVALGLIVVFNRYIPVFYNTWYLIVLASMIRFLPQSMQSAESSLNQVAPRIDEAARSLGYSPLKVVYRVILPLIMPGVLAGGALVFVSTMKELPATLLLRPPGFDTIAVRIWVETSEAMYHMAAPAALIIVLISLIPLKILLRKS